MKTIAERFWEKVDVRGPDECWPWMAGLRQGYGRFTITHGKGVQAHRVAYELTKGPIPPGLDVLHDCDFPPCCNPSHLWPGTNLDNVRDSVAKGRRACGDRNGAHIHPQSRPYGERNGAYTHPERHPRGDRHGMHAHPERAARGERHGSVKLSEKEVLEIRSRYVRGRITQQVLADEYGVRQTQISRIVRQEAWGCLSQEVST